MLKLISHYNPGMFTKCGSHILTTVNTSQPLIHWHVRDWIAQLTWYPPNHVVTHSSARTSVTWPLVPQSHDPEFATKQILIKLPECTIYTAQTVLYRGGSPLLAHWVSHLALKLWWVVTMEYHPIYSFRYGGVNTATHSSHPWCKLFKPLLLVRAVAIYKVFTEKPLYYTLFYIIKGTFTFTLHLTDLSISSTVQGLSH